MSSKVIKTGKITLSPSISELQVSFDENFNHVPSIKVTSKTCTNIYISEVSVSNFKINKNVLEEVEVHYIAIEGDSDD